MTNSKNTNKQHGLLRHAVLLGLFGATTAANAGIPAGYYDSANTSSASALHSSLHEIIDDHQRFPYTSSSTDTWDILESADEDPNNSNNIIDIYKNTSYPKAGGGNNNYNREHTWPKSYGFPNDGSSNYAYTDAHHLFLSDSSYNSSRSNKPFANCTSGCSEKTTAVNHGRGGAGQSNWTAGSYEDGSWQTWDGRKGDVARALMYMAVRYEGGTHGVTGYSEPDLILTDNRSLIGSSSTGSNISTAYMGLRSVLIQWHKEDPVDSFEQQHNDTVYMFQGNRNPFVDHPEWVSCVFENVCNGGSGDTTPPSVPSGLSATGGDNAVALSWSANTDSDLLGYNLYRSTTSGSGFSKVNTSLITSTSYSDTGLASETTYYYVLAAVDTSYNESATGTQADATTNVGAPAPQVAAWINEIHYDNASTDTNEGVEIAGNAGASLAGWSIVAYNGNGGASYGTTNLSGTFADQSNGIGTQFFAISGLQNGSPDGIALVDDTGAVVQFLSYEGSFTATNGAASGMTSTDIGVSETSSTPSGYSLQLAGEGSTYADFTWQSAATSTYGALNNGQTISGGPVNENPVASFTHTCNGLGCTFDASASSDSDGTIASYSWDFGDGQNGTGVNASNSYANEGDYNVVLTVTDDQGATDSTTLLITVEAPVAGGTAWINEFHYDNSSTDTGESIEVAGPAGTNLSGWSLVGYNGNGGAAYKTVNLSGTIADQQNGFGAINFAFSGLQNGGPDGMALVDNTGAVVQFLSYEGTFTAVGGAADGMTSENVGVTETSSTTVGYSLQLSGQGTQYSDFTWESPAANTYNAVNNNQTFGTSTPNQAPVANNSQSCTILSCTFDGSASTDSDGTIVSYSWDFGDSNTATGANATHTYAADGTYTVTLTVTDDRGATSVSTVDVTVADVVTEPDYFENTTAANVADNTAIYSGIQVTRTGDAGLVEVSVNMTHNYRGDISLKLFAPDGTKFVLKNKKNGDSGQDIVETYLIDATNISATGTWSLKVKDHFSGDEGTLNNWSLQF